MRNAGNRNGTGSGSAPGMPRRAALQHGAARLPAPGARRATKAGSRKAALTLYRQHDFVKDDFESCFPGPLSTAGVMRASGGYFFALHFSAVVFRFRLVRCAGLESPAHSSILLQQPRVSVAPHAWRNAKFSGAVPVQQARRCRSASRPTARRIFENKFAFSTRNFPKILPRYGVFQAHFSTKMQAEFSRHHPGQKREKIAGRFGWGKMSISRGFRTGY